MSLRYLDVPKAITTSLPWVEWVERDESDPGLFWPVYGSCLKAFGEVLETYIHHTSNDAEVTLDKLAEFDRFFQQVYEQLPEPKPKQKPEKECWYHGRDVDSINYEGHTSSTEVYSCSINDLPHYENRFGYSDYAFIAALVAYDLNKLPYYSHSLVLQLIRGLQYDLGYWKVLNQDPEEGEEEALVTLVKKAVENDIKLCLNWDALRVLSTLPEEEQRQIADSLTCGRQLLECPAAQEDRSLLSISSSFKRKVTDLLRQMQAKVPPSGRINAIILQNPCVPRELLYQSRRQVRRQSLLHEIFKNNSYSWYVVGTKDDLWFPFLNSYSPAYHYMAAEVIEKCDEKITIGEFVKFLENLLG